MKMWDDPDWSRRITPRLHVGMVDEELPLGKEGGRKSWYIALTQHPDLLKKYGPVKGLPENGTTLLLFEDDVVALVGYLRELDESGLLDELAEPDYKPSAHRRSLDALAPAEHHDAP